MPRVNRDISRRLASRRERERRRPPERRYQFAPSASAGSGTAEVAAEAGSDAPRSIRTPSAPPAGAELAAPRRLEPASATLEEYGHVASDLRRVALVVALLLALQIILALILAH